jgi:hypothetical protein
VTAIDGEEVERIIGQGILIHRVRRQGPDPGVGQSSGGHQPRLQGFDLGTEPEAP